MKTIEEKKIYSRLTWDEAKDALTSKVNRIRTANGKPPIGFDDYEIIIRDKNGNRAISNEDIDKIDIISCYIGKEEDTEESDTPSEKEPYP